MSNLYKLNAADVVAVNYPSPLALAAAAQVLRAMQGNDADGKPLGEVAEWLEIIVKAATK